MKRYMTPILLVLFILLATCLPVAAQAPQGGLYNTFHPAVPGAGVAIQCGGAQSGIRGAYLCSISQTGGTVTVNYQDANSDAQMFTFSLAGGQADGVVTMGTIDTAGTNLRLVVTGSGGSTSHVDIPIPAILRAAAASAPVHVSTSAATQNANQFTITDITPALTTPASGTTVIWKTPPSITPTTTLGVSVVLGNPPAHPLVRPPNDAIRPEDLLPNTPYAMFFDGATFELVDDTTLEISTSPPGDVVTGTGAAGSTGTVSDAGHTHGGDRVRTISTSDPQNIQGAPASGGTGQVSDAGHVHNASLFVESYFTGNNETGITSTPDTVNKKINFQVNFPTAAPIHIATAAATQNGNRFELATLVPDLTTPAIGTTVVFKTPSTITAGTAGANLHFNGTSYPVLRPGNVVMRTEHFIADQPYMVVYNGNSFEIVDDTVSVPPGGTTGQVLKKNTGADYDYDWAAEAGGGGGLTAPQVGALFDGNTETGATVAYNTTTQKIDVTVPPEIIEPDAMTGILPACTQAQLGFLGRQGQNIRVCTRFIAGPAPPTVTFSAYSATGFRGVFDYPADVPNPVHTNTMFSRGLRTWYRYNTDHWTNIAAAPTNWLDAYANQAAAEAHVSAVGQIVWWTGQSDIQVVATFSDTNVTYGYEWQPEQERQDLLGRPEVPTPAATNRGDVLGVDNNGEYRLEDPPIPARLIPYVGQLPTVTDDSPDLVFLSSPYTEGARADATITVGFSTTDTEAGYGDGTFFTGGLGSIDKASPLGELTGDGEATSYSLDEIRSANEGWINEFNRIVVEGTEYNLGPTRTTGGIFSRDILQFPRGLSLATVSVNFIRPDDSYYWTDGATASHAPGLYQKVFGAYQHLGAIAHIDGTRPPVDPPTMAAQMYVDDNGDFWISGDLVTTTTTDPSIDTFGSFVNTYYLATALPSQLSANGEFTRYGSGGTLFAQYQDGSLVNDVSWFDIWTYIASIDDTGFNRNLRDNSTFLGFFATLQDAAEARQRETDDTRVYFYAPTTDATVIYEITAFTRGETLTTDQLFWNGPFISEADIGQYQTYKGVFSGTETYHYGDIVRSSDTLWISESDNHSGNSPRERSAHWSLLRNDYRGDWHNSAAYVVGQVVRYPYTGSVQRFWIARSDNTNETPSDTNTNWRELGGARSTQGAVLHSTDGNPDSELQTEQQGLRSEFNLTLTPESTTSKIALDINFTIRSSHPGTDDIDDGGIAYEVRRLVGGTSTTLTELRESYLHVLSTEADIRSRHVDVTVNLVDEPNTDQSVVYSVWMYRILPSATDTTLTYNLQEYDMRAVDYGSGGSHGTEVIANPTGAATEDLTRIGIGGINYDIPIGTVPDWDAAATYGLGEFVRYPFAVNTQQFWISLADGNTNNEPSSTSTSWRQVDSVGGGVGGGLVEHTGPVLPDPSTITGDDLHRLHAAIDSGYIQEVARIKSADQDRGRLTVATLNATRRGFFGNRGHLSPAANITGLYENHGAGQNSTIEVEVDTSGDPLDRAGPLTIYFRPFGSMDDFHVIYMAWNGTLNKYVQQTPRSGDGLFRSGREYEVILREFDDNTRDDTAIAEGDIGGEGDMGDRVPFAAHVQQWFYFADRDDFDHTTVTVNEYAEDPRVPPLDANDIGGYIAVSATDQYEIAHGRFRGDYGTTTRYSRGDVVRFGSHNWLSLSDNNTGNGPTSTGPHWLRLGTSFRSDWTMDVTYGRGDYVRYEAAGETQWYLSLNDNNIGNEPSATSAHWVRFDGTGGGGTLQAGSVRGQRLAHIFLTQTGGLGEFRVPSTESERSDTLTTSDLGNNFAWVRDANAPTEVTVAIDDSTPVINLPQERINPQQLGYLAQVEILPEVGRLQYALTITDVQIVLTAAPLHTIGVGTELSIAGEIMTISSVPQPGQTGEAARTYGVTRDNPTVRDAMVLVQLNEYEMTGEGILLHGTPSPQNGGTQIRHTVNIPTGAPLSADATPEIGVRLIHFRPTATLQARNQIAVILPGDNIRLFHNTRVTVYLAEVRAPEPDLSHLDAEVLHDSQNRRLDVRAFEYRAATNQNRFDLGRTLSNLDDHKLMVINMRYEYAQNDGVNAPATSRILTWSGSPKAIRQLIEHPCTGSGDDAQLHSVLSVATRHHRYNADDDVLDYSDGRLSLEHVLFGRRRNANNHDELCVAFATRDTATSIIRNLETDIFIRP